MRSCIYINMHVYNCLKWLTRIDGLLFDSFTLGVAVTEIEVWLALCIYWLYAHTLTHTQLSCDSDTNVRYGAELLDRLMKDVVSENPHFDIDNFIVLLRDRIYTQDGYARQFLVSWVSPFWLGSWLHITCNTCACRYLQSWWYNIIISLFYQLSPHDIVLCHLN